MSSLSFQWDEEKRTANLAKHGLDFRDAGRIMRGPVLHRMSPRGAEVRLVTVGPLADKLVAIVWTPRDGQVRVISMRRARREEAAGYRQLYG
jgi:uncharacterized DUF497 family protein